MKRGKFGIYTIGYGTYLGAVLLLSSWLFSFAPHTQTAWGWWPLWTAGFMVLTAWGYLKLTRWGFRMMQLNAGALVAFSVIMVARYNQLPFLSNVAWGLFALAYTTVNKDCFDSRV